MLLPARRPRPPLQICKSNLPPLMDRWKAVKSQDLPALNKQLKGANLPEVKLESAGASGASNRVIER